MPAEPVLMIGDRKIGPGQPPYIIAELSANHNGSLERALKIIEAAAEAGADAVKLQTYTADTMTIDHAGHGFTIEGGLWNGRTLYSLYQEAHTPWDWHEALFAKGADLGITVFSSPFDGTAVEFLEALNAPAYKIASFEAIDLPLVRKAASTGKPVIISTGLASQREIDDAVDAARAAGHGGLALLHCVSSYPAPVEECNLRTIPLLAERYHAVIGLSDHTLGTSVAGAAVALGGCLIEKHLTLARADGGPDSAFSLEPDELAELVQNARSVWSALGEASLQRKPSEAGNAAFRRSLYVTRDLKSGEALTPDNLRSIRPGHGLAPKYYDQLLGKPVKRDTKRGTPMTWDLVD